MTRFEITKVATSMLATLVLSATCVLAAVGPVPMSQAVAATPAAK